MNIAQLSEHLKDVPQNTLVGYAQNPNSVVPQFLALAEIQRRQQLQGAVQPPQSTVANDVLAQANPAPQGIAQLSQPAPEQMAQQLPENQPGVSQLASRVAPQGFAGGGIIAFANGGMSEDDEDYEDYTDKMESAKRRSMIDSAMDSIKDRVAGVMSILPKSYDEAKARASSTASRGMDDLKSLLAKVGHLESGNKDYDKYGRLITSPKGAEGRMQTLRSTQRDPGFGVAPARDSSVEEKNRVGEEYFAAMLDKFKDPKLAAMAYNWGPGNVQKWLESGRKTPVPQETVKYASNFAQGGIARLAVGGSSDDAVTDAPSAHDLFLQRLAAERDALNKEHETDTSLALLQAGLGMMSGSSPYALQNIGQGGMQGIAAYQAAQKQKGAELAALRKVEGNVLDSQILGDIKRLGIEERSAAAKNALEAKKTGAEERSRLLNQKEVNDAREAALARFNSDPGVKKIAAKIEETTPGTPEYEWYTIELNRLRNNALADAKVPGATFIPKAAPFPTGKVEAPSSLWQMLPGTKKYSKEDMEALEWANANPLDPRANTIKERFK